MNLSARIIEKTDWEKYELAAHANLFGSDGMDQFKDYNFCVLVETDHGEKLCYATIKELDSETAYMNFGGTFSRFRGQGKSYEGFRKIVSAVQEKYKRVGFTCRTKNTGMIKLGLNERFEIVGMRLVYGFPSLEFLLERAA